jgi:hypothetical protein
MAFPDCSTNFGDRVGTDTWIQAPYTDEEYLSYTTKQQHPGNGVWDFKSDPYAYQVARYSVARTRRAYCTVTPPSCVYSLTPNMRQAYPGGDLNRGSENSSGHIGPYKFSTDS